MGKYEHGQLDKANLTFRDLNVIEASFVTILAGYYHTRIEYPDQKDPDALPDKTADKAQEKAFEKTLPPGKMSQQGKSSSDKDGAEKQEKPDTKTEKAFLKNTEIEELR